MGSQPFGSEFNDEMDAIRAEMRAEGITDWTTLHFEGSRRYIERHKNDVPFRERQKEWLARQVKQAGLAVRLTDDEVEYLRWRLDGANDPLARSILEKLGSN